MNLKELVLVILPLIMVSTFEGSYGLYSDEVVFTWIKGSYQTAVDYCRSFGMTLIRVQSDADYTLLQKLVKAKSVYRFWVDGNDIKKKGTWVNSDNSPLNYTKWAAPSSLSSWPSNWVGHDCAEGYDTSNWYNNLCNEEIGIICFNERRNRKALSAQQIIITGQKGTLQAAQDLCNSLGLKVVRVESEEDNSLVTAQSRGKSIGTFWVDGNDIKTEGTWVNSDNLLLTYKKWGAGQPDNWKGTENCASLSDGNSYWNDIICTAEYGIICYKESGRYNNQTTNFEFLGPPVMPPPPPGYPPMDFNLNYADAMAHCKSINMDLVKTDSEIFNKLVYDFAVQNSIGAYWIDLNDNATESSWVTSDGSSTSYRNFAKGEPNGGRGENCVVVNKDALWNDVSCTNKYAYICYIIFG